MGGGSDGYVSEEQRELGRQFDETYLRLKLEHMRKMEQRNSQATGTGGPRG